MVVRVLASIVLVLAACTSGPAPDPAHALEQRIIAPCCWRQTLADHDSPLAAELRGEIADRLASGETSAAIEGDLVARYGPRVLAMGTGDPRPWLGALIAVTTLAGLALAIGVGRRWRRRTASGVPRAVAILDAADEERLDEELRAIDA